MGAQTFIPLECLLKWESFTPGIFALVPPSLSHQVLTVHDIRTRTHRDKPEPAPDSLFVGCFVTCDYELTTQIIQPCVAPHMCNFTLRSVEENHVKGRSQGPTMDITKKY